MKNFKENATLHIFVQEALSVADDKIKSKITGFFN